MQDAAKLQKRLNTAKSTILLIGALTIINTVLIAFNADVVFTFSAYVPQFVTWLFMDIAADLQVKRYLYIGIAIAILMGLIYVGIWFGAKKKNGFVVAALVLFCLDSAVLLYDVIVYADASFIIDIVFHIWAIVELVLGVGACVKLKKLPPQEQPSVQQYSVDPAQADCYNPVPQNNMQTEMNENSAFYAESPIIRMSENKGRVSLSAQYNGMNVEVRRSKGLTELIVDGKVYAEKEGVLETEYTIYARVSGVLFSTSMTMQSVMYLYANEELLAKKIRWV